MRSWLQRHRWLSAVGLAVGVLVVVGGALNAVSVAQLRTWTADCVARGGHVDEQPRFHDDNPVLTQTSDPIYRCLSVSGGVISERS